MWYKLKGFSLIEVLVAMAVMSTGLLAVATFQTELLSSSGTNKARTEAISLAQARIEEFRNYTLDITDRTEFDSAYAVTTGYTTETFPIPNSQSTTSVLHGNNADFTRKYAITGGDGEIKNLSVMLVWSDRRGNEQTVSLSTQLDYTSPRSTGDVANEQTAALVPSATGRAYLGEGELPAGAPTTDNGDGTKLYEDGALHKLAVGDDIVLTLEDACQSVGNCIDFVKINGRVYIDSSSGRIPGEVYVKASDAAYCQRYYMADDGNGNTVAHTITDTTTTTLATTSNGDYKYFDYTCYLGGGWHGNIGIVMDGGIGQQEKICIGDPIVNSPHFTRDDPVISSRRVYRGMLYEKDANNNDEPVTTTVTDAYGNTTTITKFYSLGIADETVLPDPNTSDPGHNFIVAQMATSDTEGTKCITNSTMVRADAEISGVAGALFDDMPAGFVCLNENAGHLDVFDTSIYGADNFCDYNPSDPPSARYTVSGSIVVYGDATIASELALATVNTSDGPGNCTPIGGANITWGSLDVGSGTYTGTYTCDVYAWTNGWTGYIQALSNSGDVYCATTQLSHTGVTSNLTGDDFSCAAGSNVVINGSYTATGNRSLSASMTDATGGTCAVDTDLETYSCTTGVFNDPTWSGSITYVASSGYVCYNGTAYDDEVTVNFTHNPGVYNNVDVHISSNSNCP